MMEKFGEIDTKNWPPSKALIKSTLSRPQKNGNVPGLHSWIWWLIRFLCEFWSLNCRFLLNLSSSNTVSISAGQRTSPAATGSMRSRPRATLELHGNRKGTEGQPPHSQTPFVPSAVLDPGSWESFPGTWIEYTGWDKKILWMCGSLEFRFDPKLGGTLLSLLVC